MNDLDTLASLLDRKIAVKDRLHELRQREEATKAEIELALEAQTKLGQELEQWVAARLQERRGVTA